MFLEKLLDHAQDFLHIFMNRLRKFQFTGLKSEGTKIHHVDTVLFVLELLKTFVARSLQKRCHFQKIMVAEA